MQHVDHELLDEELARLAHTLRTGDHMMACLQLAEFALKLDRYIRREERALSYAYQLIAATPPKAMTTVHNEHTSLRHLVAMVANALDKDEARRGAEIVGRLRSVLLLHVAKEELLLAPPSSTAVH
jgi:hypothetical protein